MNTERKNTTSPSDEDAQRKPTLSEDTDYEKPAGQPGFTGDNPTEIHGHGYPKDEGYGEYLDIGNEL